MNTPEQNETQKQNFRYVQIDAVGVSISNVAAPFLPVFLTRLGASNSINPQLGKGKEVAKVSLGTFSLVQSHDKK